MSSPQEQPGALSEEEKIMAARDSHWPSVLYHIHIHLAAFYGLFLIFTEAYYTTFFFAIFMVMLGSLAVNTGAHRLWSHGSYKASTGLRIALMLAQTSVGQCSIYDWVLDHRIHHKHFGTDKDPYNHNRGFFYAQLGSRMQTDRSDYEKIKSEIDMSDIEQDEVVMFQKKYYWFIMPIVAFLLPVNFPVEYWGESILVSVYVVGFFRYCLGLHMSWLVNSAILIWGLDPKARSSSDSNLVFVVTRSHWPHYHYMLPWDYQTGEFGTYGAGCSTAFIRVYAAAGWASELKTLGSDAVKEALTLAVDTGKPLVECLNEVGLEHAKKIPDAHVLEYEKYK
uniref:Acyl-CoA Delta(11) desaturase n=1 Tax=Aceria tosichella TaxID=561515 RepID=A0A6G1SJ94_9ACAR